MNVEITPIDHSRRAVFVDGTRAGVIRLARLSVNDRWHDYTGRLRTGVRWLPDGVDPRIDGPHSPADAALLLLALEGYDREAAIRALYRRAA